MDTPKPVLPPYIDSTMLTCFRSCPRKFWLEFVLKLRPAGLSIDLHAGGCFASALETTYRGVHEKKLNLQSALQIAHAEFLLNWGDVEVPAYKRTAKSKDRMWEAVYNPFYPDIDPDSPGYFNVYDPLADHIQPYIAADGKATMEYTFAIPLEPLNTNPYWSNVEVPSGFPAHPISGDPFILAGRFDMLGSYLGRPIVRDEKTSGISIASNWADQWDLRNQFLGYVWACQQGGLDVDSVCVRGIGILKTKLSHGEAIKTYPNYLLARWHEQLRRDLWRLRRCYDEGYFDFDLSDACSSWGGCAFKTPCSAPDDQMSSWLSNFETRNWNPLAKNPTAGEPV